MSHTPGPWRYMSICDENGEDDGGVLIGEHIVVADYLHLNNLANARLIAAAPELYEALEELRDKVWRIIDLHRDSEARAEANMALERANAALSKARGDEEDENA